MEALPTHDDGHVLGKGVGVEGLGERVARDAVGGEVLDEALASLLNGVDIHETDSDMFRSRIERFVVRACESDGGDVVGRLRPSEPLLTCM